MSDHAVPTIVMSSGFDNVGPGYWKLNTKLLEHEDYCEQITDIIAQACDEIDDVKLRWEMIKMNVRGHTFKANVRKKKSDQNKLDALDSKIAP